MALDRQVAPPKTPYLPSWPLMTILPWSTPLLSKKASEITRYKILVNLENMELPQNSDEHMVEGDRSRKMPPLEEVPIHPHAQEDPDIEEEDSLQR